jgi:hypothetical protein
VVDWTGLDQERTNWLAVVSTVMNAIVQKCGEILDKFRKCELRIIYISPLVK